MIIIIRFPTVGTEITAIKASGKIKRELRRPLLRFYVPEAQRDLGNGYLPTKTNNYLWDGSGNRIPKEGKLLQLPHLGILHKE